MNDKQPKVQSGQSVLLSEEELNQETIHKDMETIISPDTLETAKSSEVVNGSQYDYLGEPAIDPKQMGYTQVQADSWKKIEKKWEKYTSSTKLNKKGVMSALEKGADKDYLMNLIGIEQSKNRILLNLTSSAAESLYKSGFTFAEVKEINNHCNLYDQEPKDILASLAEKIDKDGVAPIFDKLAGKIRCQQGPILGKKSSFAEILDICKNDQVLINFIKEETEGKKNNWTKTINKTNDVALEQFDSHTLVKVKGLQDKIQALPGNKVENNKGSKKIIDFIKDIILIMMGKYHLQSHRIDATVKSANDEHISGVLGHLKVDANKEIKDAQTPPARVR